MSALLVSCDREKPQERHCVDGEGRFVDEGLCAGGAAGPTGGVASEATGSWDSQGGGTQANRGGFHFIWIPYGMFGGMGSYAPGYVRSGAGSAAGARPAAPGTTSEGSVTRGGFGATGAAHASPSSSGT